jgi:hypothetical protein
MQQTPLEPAPPARGTAVDLSAGALDPGAAGTVRFVDPAARATIAAGTALDVRVDSVSPLARGQLADLIDDAIERALGARDAGPRGAEASQGPDASLEDQLARARRAGAPRLVLTLPTLAPIASTGHALGAEDSETLLFWSRATQTHPVDLCLHAADGALGAHVAPVPLRVALAPSRIDTAPTAADPGDWRAATLALTAARGPQPLATLERLFATSYLPLDTALHDPGRPADRRAVRARDEFRANFSRVYLEAFHAFALTGKRPRMVLDAPEIAARIARQTSARTSQLLLVDAMRYDLGVLVKEAVGRLLGPHATLAHEMILWSALPTTTSRQLATIAQGVSALQAEADEEREDGVVRGRTAQTIRRLKTGSRDVYRLDLCDVRVREAGERVLPLLPSIADDVAATVARHAGTLTPRTLLFVFGDHGFTLEADSQPSSGGSSPEEVLVPAFAFLMGEAH